MAFDFATLRGAKAVPDPAIKEFITGLNLAGNLYGEETAREFLPAYRDWLAASELNQLRGLHEFSSLAFTHGTIQAFDLFYAKHLDRRFRFFRGEFVYHRLSLRNRPWKYVEDDDLREGDALIMSVPFSDLGAKHPEAETVLDLCEARGIPVLLDFAYYSLARGLELDLGRSCLDTLTFSLSKAFWGADKARIGMRCQRKNSDDPIDIFNSLGMANQLGAALGLELVRRFPPDHNQRRYRGLQEKVCGELGISPSDCVVFGLGGEDFAELNRGSRWNRVGLTERMAPWLQSQ